MLGVYRKSHIPNDVGYQEKQYFSPGDTGFRVWHTQYAPIGVAICWDQWFPESARAMALLGAELLFYPSAIGTDPGLRPRHEARLAAGDAGARGREQHAGDRLQSHRHWKRPPPRISSSRFFGSSFIADQAGTKVEEADTDGEAVLVHTFDLEACRRMREYWSLFRDRRPDLYGPLLTHDGRHTSGAR